MLFRSVLALLLLALLAIALLATAAQAPSGAHAHPSLAVLPPSSRARTIYPADVYGPGADARLPLGTTRYWLLGPRDGDKVTTTARAHAGRVLTRHCRSCSSRASWCRRCSGERSRSNLRARASAC